MELRSAPKNGVTAKALAMLGMLYFDEPHNVRAEVQHLRLLTVRYHIRTELNACSSHCGCLLGKLAKVLLQVQRSRLVKR